MAFAAAVLVLLFVVYFWSARMWDIIQTWQRFPDIDPDSPVDLPPDAPLISVIVPAHNEEAAIEACIRSVMSQDYPNFELIVVDDRCTDKTLSLAQSLCRESPNCRVISVKDLPDGWTGKCHALDTAQRNASGQWLAFLDADSTLEPSALRHCYDQAVRHRVNLITLTPKFVVRTFWDKVLQPAFAAMCCILFPPGKVNDPSSSIALANGMFYMISRDAYDRIGGHYEVRDLAVEDVGIGKRVKAAGLGILMANGRRIMETRMYMGFSDTLQGWTRILSASMNHEVRQVLKHLSVHVLMSLPVLAAALFVYIPAARLAWPMWWPALPLVCAVGMAVAPCFFLDQMGLPRKYAPLLMLGNLFLIWVFVVILKKVFFRDSLQWRGTTYASCRYEPGKLEPDPPHVCRRP